MTDNLLSKNIFLQGLKILSVLPQGKNPVDLGDSFTIEAWYGALNDISDEKFQKAVIYLLRNSKWHPVPVDIRKAAGFATEIEQGIITTPEQQWDVFRSRFNSYAIKSAITDNTHYYDDPITDAVAKTICMDYAMSHISEAGNWRARFINAYNSLKETGVATSEMQKIGAIIGNSIEQKNGLKLVKP